MINYSTNQLLVGVLIVVSTIPILIFGGYFLDTETQHVEQMKLDELHQIVNFQHEKTNLFFNERISNIQLHTNLPEFKNSIKSIFNDQSDKNLDTKTMIMLFEKILNTYDYESIWIVDSHFNPILTVGENVEYAKSTYISQDSNTISQMESSFYLSDVYYDTGSNTNELFLSAPLIIEEVLYGYLVFDIKLDNFFKNTLYELDFTESGETVIVQEQNNNIVFIKELRFDKSYSLSKPIAFNYELALPAQESALGVAGDGFSVDYRGEDVIAVWKYLPITRWGIVAKIDTNTAFEDLEQTRQNIFLIVLGLASFSFVVGIILTRNMTDILSRVKNASIQVSKKNYDVIVDPSGSSEHKTITNVFNEMTKSLKSDQIIIENQFKELQLAEIQKEEFAAMASHELKTPLVPINGYCEMLLESGLIGELNDRQKEFVEKIALNSDHLKNLIEKILQAQRLDLGKQKWNYKTREIGKFMNVIHECHSPLMDEKNIHFTNNTEDNISITADFIQLQEVFTNLIQNSVDFVPVNGTIEINAKDLGKIEIHAKEDRDKILFSVKDNGVGIPKDKQQHLFKKFYQVDTSITRKHGGTGLGLAICKGIVEGLGGKIWVESEVGKGTTFFFSIPKNNIQNMNENN